MKVTTNSILSYLVARTKKHLFMLQVIRLSEFATDVKLNVAEYIGFMDAQTVIEPLSG